ncbi:hypothetical protein BRC90_01910 [Halobacteriales archaeon QS_4_69_34]|nr:MAG: hypothetical protein BRC90_01910 [Halobacteriales archaeon QS_4_69_34]
MNVREVVPRDAIPSIDDPAFAREFDGDPDEEVIVVEAEPARAYPVRILDYHEVVNDVVDGEPRAITWCPLCGSAIVYGRSVDGRTLTFGVSGKLADDDLVLYDRETGSEWKQSSGVCIAGAFEGERLDALPASVLSLGRFRREYPEGVVLQPPGGESEAASANDAPATIDYDAEPYRQYVESEGFGLAVHRSTGGHGDGRTGSREWTREDLDPKDVVLGIEHGGRALGFPATRVRAAGGVVETTVGGAPVVVFATAEGIYAFENPGYSFAPVEGDGEGGSFRADGTRWDGTTGRAADGRKLGRVPAKRLFAFAWQDDHGPDAFWS